MVSTIQLQSQCNYQLTSLSSYKTYCRNQLWYVTHQMISCQSAQINCVLSSTWLVLVMLRICMWCPNNNNRCTVGYVSRLNHYDVAIYIYIYIYVYISSSVKTYQHYYLNKLRGPPQWSQVLVNLYKEAVWNTKPTRSILNASFRSIYSDLPQAKSVTGPYILRQPPYAGHLVRAWVFWCFMCASPTWRWPSSWWAK